MVYKHIEPRILVEEFINDGPVLFPTDYKLFVFHARSECFKSMQDVSTITVVAPILLIY